MPGSEMRSPQDRIGLALWRQSLSDHQVEIDLSLSPGQGVPVKTGQIKARFSSASAPLSLSMFFRPWPPWPEVTRFGSTAISGSLLALDAGL